MRPAVSAIALLPMSLPCRCSCNMSVFVMPVLHQCCLECCNVVCRHFLMPSLHCSHRIISMHCPCHESPVVPGVLLQVECCKFFTGDCDVCCKRGWHQWANEWHALSHAAAPGCCGLFYIMRSTCRAKAEHCCGVQCTLVGSCSAFPWPAGHLLRDWTGQLPLASSA